MVAFADKLKAVRARGARLRSEAFVDYQPVVCGMVLNAVSLATYNRLIAFDSPFVAGGPVTMEDVMRWVWVQHPEFGQMAAKARGRVLRAVWRALHPRLPNLNAFICLASVFPRTRWLRRFRRPTQLERVTEAIAAIRHFMDEAMSGFPTADADQHVLEPDDDGPAPTKKGSYEAAPAVAFQAQILNTFRRHYGMTYAETEAIPLRRLAQLWREHLVSTLGDKTGLRMMDPAEAALWAEELAPEKTEAPRG